jgi:quercetin dioxygenase-like cupin family protein
MWQALVRVPLPADSEAVISVNGLMMPADPVAEHSHAGPTIGYIVAGEIENQVAPDPPATLRPGGHFYEAPRQLHKMMRNLSAEPATLLVFHAGRTGVPASLLKALPAEPTKLSFTTPTQWQVPLPSTGNQELRLIRLTLPVGSRTEVAPHTGPGMVYVLEGSISVVGGGSPQPQTYSAGDLFLDPANREGLIYRNLTGKEPAKLLLYHVSDPLSVVQVPPMMPYVAIQKPEFAPAAQASFAQDDDLVIGVARGKTAKAYMALVLTAWVGRRPDAGRPDRGDVVQHVRHGRRLSRGGGWAPSALRIRQHGERQRGAPGHRNRQSLAAVDRRSDLGSVEGKEAHVVSLHPDDVEGMAHAVSRDDHPEAAAGLCRAHPGTAAAPETSADLRRGAGAGRLVQ